MTPHGGIHWVPQLVALGVLSKGALLYSRLVDIIYNHPCMGEFGATSFFDKCIWLQRLAPSGAEVRLCRTRYLFQGSFRTMVWSRSLPVEIITTGVPVYSSMNSTYALALAGRSL